MLPLWYIFHINILQIFLENCQGVIQYLGDGYCDDANNVADCNYDYGDCCLENVITDYCTICECIEGKTKWLGTYLFISIRVIEILE